MAIRHLIVSSASAFALMAGTAHAQTADPNQPAPPAPATDAAQPAPSAPADAASGDEIVITGIRASLQQAIAIKRQADAVVDAVSAEDIGKFPDKNVAEALQRVTGVSISRDFGEGERVSVRGTAPNLSLTLLNGHAVATADWFVLDQLAASRSFNYLMLPAEMVSTLEVYKSPKADIEEGGIGATINVKTRMPLDEKPLTINGSLQGVYSELADKVDPNASAMISWHNQDKTFGLLFGAIYQKRHLRRDGVEVLGYTAAPEELGEDLQIPALVGSVLFKQTRERIGFNATAQWRPTDTVEMSLTGLYSHMNADNFNQNYMAWFSNMLNNGAVPTNTTVEDGTVTSGTFAMIPGVNGAVFDAIDRLAHTQTRSLDYNVDFKPDDKWAFHGQIGYTDAEGETEAQPFWETNAPTGFTFDLHGVPKIHFTDLDPESADGMTLGWASYDTIKNTDQEFYARGDVTRLIEAGPFQSIKAGLKFTNHKRETLHIAGRTGTFYPWNGNDCGGGAPCGLDTVAGSMTPGNFLSDIGGNGVLDSYLQVDKGALEDLFGTLDFVDWTPTTTARDIRFLNPQASFQITEKTYGGFVMGNFSGERWRGNLGLRLVHTDQTADGWLIGDPGGEPNPFGPITPVTFKNSYTDWLPSVNVAFDVRDDMIIRAAAARTVTRPDYASMAPQIELRPTILTGTGGNPQLDPFRADQFDISFEWYPSRQSLVSVALFYKDIQTYITSATATEVHLVEQNVNPNPAGCTSAGANLWNCAFQVTRPVNGSGGTNKGAEISWQQPIWGGFGFQANYTYSDAKKSDGRAVEGNSKHTVNLVGYFENDLLSARLAYNYRSKYFVNQDRASALTADASSSLDASVSVNVMDNLAVTFDAINLTDENLKYYGNSKAQPRAIYDNGRQFYFGVRFKY
ncbi:TonB-dependent receptor [Sphingomonas sp. SM33]|uniref:TonB-dependent receptor n=1 Tax=Sphingomonas telluris TaxID=2907998 RepID=A0ABS9VLM8_9SPHN|nr:TonB-dependent receptor [Sphingomonas telluris]MCH8615875.1 TonB-dependent receptor [Sphingomonas telluris]